MFKLNLVNKLVLLTLPIMGVAFISGCANISTHGSNQGYVYHAANGKVFYQDVNGRYYYEGKDGRYYFKRYYVNKSGKHYYRYYPDANGKYVSNSNLSVHVRERMLNDPMLKNEIITVRTHKGYVELVGAVHTRMQRERAVSLALSVPGVRYVDDDLVVKGY